MNSILVRFEHILEKGDDKTLSQPTTFAIDSVFQYLQIASIRETTLSANQWLDEAERLNFTSKTYPEQKKYVPETNLETSINSSNKNQFDLYRSDNNTITMNPMEIRTFIIELE